MGAPYSQVPSSFPSPLTFGGGGKSDIDKDSISDKSIPKDSPPTIREKLIASMVKKVINGSLFPAKKAGVLPYLFPGGFYQKSTASLLPFYKHLLPTIQAVEFRSTDGVRLQGYWAPAEKVSSETIILAHGFASNTGSMLSLGEELHNRGYNVFLFDFRAHGQSSKKKPSTIGYHEGKDIAAAVRCVKDKYPDQAKRIPAVLGHSMGASAILMMPHSLKPEDLSYVNENVDSFVLDAPYEQMNLKENPFVTRVYENAKIFPDFRKSIADKFVEQMNSIETQEKLELPCKFDNLQPANWFGSSELAKKPILLLHGENDKRTPFAQSLRIQEQLPQIDFVKLNADHMDYEWKPKTPLHLPLIGDKRAALRDRANFLNALDAHLKSLSQE